MGEAEDVFGICYDFESPNEQAAKAKLTRLINAEAPMQDVTGAAHGGELPDWWTSDPVEWKAWTETKRAPYKSDANLTYAECNRYSRDEFLTIDPKKASATISAYIKLAWIDMEDSRE